MFFFNLEFYGIVLMIFVLKSSLFLDEEYNQFYKFSDLNFWMVFLVVYLFLMFLSIDINYKMSLSMLFFFLYYMLMMNNFVNYFLIYEMIFVLIMFSIIMLGYSFERLLASFLMMFYSFLFSSPLMMMILVFDYNFLIKEWFSYSVLMKYFFVGSFMVKFPVFGFHYWLPVAHVEASTVGSMILAGVLLKLGCVGVFYVVMYMKFMVKLHWLSISILLLMLMILNLSDLKMMIAYSSVAHMTLVFYIIMLGYDVGKKGALVMMLYHGYVSPLMFWVVGILAWWKTRSILVVKMISFSYIFILILFFLCILNMGFPPFMGFMSEILMLKSLINMKYIMWIIIFSVLFSCYYNIYLFWCFNGFMGLVYKMSFFSFDLFMFLMFVIFLSFY